MLRFVDLKTGNLFDGTSPYVFWMEGGQSVGLMYNMKICFVSDLEEVEVSLPKDSLFKLVDVRKLEEMQMTNIYGFDYYDVNELCVADNKGVSGGVQHHGYFVHMVYVLCGSDQEGEYIDNLTINGSEYMVGADFYTENEPLYINLSNNGVEIPNSIQKALYDVNVHEDKCDNITMNRKWKELLINLWEVVANKGSYKSLYNSLKWFEYGDLLKLCEVWKGEDSYSVRDVQMILGEKYFESLSNFKKTTYMAIYMAMQEIVSGEYDDEKNPLLEHITSKWSTQDLSLKLCMLGNFYKTYFMPIHLDLIHSTIEDVVYSNTFKSRVGSVVSREDYVCNNKCMHIDIKNEEDLILTNVNIQVCTKTLFSSRYDRDYVNESDLVIVGVEDVVEGPLNNDDIRELGNQLYSGCGVVARFHVELENMIDEDYVKREELWMRKNGSSNIVHIIDNQVIKNKDFDFNVLLKEEGEWDLRLRIDTGSGDVYVKRLVFNVLDNHHVKIEVYKIRNNGGTNVIGSNNRVNRLSENPIHSIYKQYIPCMLSNKNNWKGICLNHMLVLKGRVDDEYLNNWYYISYKEVSDEVVYTICISKAFGFIIDDEEKSKWEVKKEDYIYVPEYHHLEELSGEKIEDYVIYDSDAICVVPNLNYGKKLEDVQWRFINVSKLKDNVIEGVPVREPFITNDNGFVLDKGYYNIELQYKVGKIVNKVTLESAFIKK